MVSISELCNPVPEIHDNSLQVNTVHESSFNSGVSNCNYFSNDNNNNYNNNYNNTCNNTCNNNNYNNYNNLNSPQKINNHHTNYNNVYHYNSMWNSNKLNNEQISNINGNNRNRLNIEEYNKVEPQPISFQNKNQPLSNPPSSRRVSDLHDHPNNHYHFNNKQPHWFYHQQKKQFNQPKQFHPEKDSFTPQKQFDQQKTIIQQKNPRKQLKNRMASFRWGLAPTHSKSRFPNTRNSTTPEKLSKTHFFKPRKMFRKVPASSTKKIPPQLWKTIHDNHHRENNDELNPLPLKQNELNSSSSTSTSSSSSTHSLNEDEEKTHPLVLFQHNNSRHETDSDDLSIFKCMGHIRRRQRVRAYDSMVLKFVCKGQHSFTLNENAGNH